jgi:hypothetical protein
LEDTAIKGGFALLEFTPYIALAAIVGLALYDSYTSHGLIYYVVEGVNDELEALDKWLFKKWIQGLKAIRSLFFDPNDKYGPGGFGSSHFVTPTAVLPYRIDFENDPTATAPAQIVTITDQLDPNLNWTTFQLTGIGFGDTKATCVAREASE